MVKLNPYQQLVADGKFAEALRVLDKSRDKLFAAGFKGEYYADRGAILDELKRYPEALTDHFTAIRHNPKLTKIYLNIANTYNALGDYSNARDYYEKVLYQYPADVAIMSNYGAFLHQRGEYHNAEVMLRRALHRDPFNQHAHFCLSMLLLSQGREREGWKEYDWRTKAADNSKLKFPWPRWQGENLRGKRIYIRTEQGAGDTIQFIRYLRYLHFQGAIITLHTSKNMERLCTKYLCDMMGMIFTGAHKVTVGKTPTDPALFDYYTWLISIPQYLPDDYKDEIPYMFSDRLSGKQIGKFRIGVTWLGNPDFIFNHKRSIGVANIQRIVDAFPEVEFVSIQVARDYPNRVAKNYASDWVDTMDIIQYCDLIVGSDTGPIHLAAAMGKPVYLMVSVQPDWRWGITGDSCKWYPSIRLFRQSIEGDWSDVVASVTGAICR